MKGLGAALHRHLKAPPEHDPEPDKPLFSDRARCEVIAIREASGLNVPEFARRLGVTKQCIYQVENGEARPGIDLLDKIDDIWGFMR